MRYTQHRRLMQLTALALLAVGHDLSAHSVPAITPEETRLEFSARFGNQPFVCGQSYQLAAHPGLSLTPTDLRFYISDIELVNAQGKAVPLQLKEDGLWQQGTLALLDFEQVGPGCHNGTPLLNTQVTGTLPPGHYHTLRFTLGVPFERNHGMPTLAAPPLNLTAMFWVWQAGYKFFKFDAQVQNGQQGASGFSVHLGSTECSSASRTTAPASPCRHPNRVRVELTDFNSRQQRVVLDLSRLLQGSRPDFNTPDTPPGCMSGQDDPDCQAIFRQLGLPFGTSHAGSQQLFHVETR